MAILKSDTTDLESLAKFFSKVAPRESRWALARTLNNAASRLRGNMAEELTKGLAIRNRGFVKASLRFEGTKGTVPIDDQSVRAGSIKLDRTTGWIEQTTGGTDNRKRVFAGKGRTRGGAGQAKQRMRFTPDKDIPRNKAWIGPGRGNLSWAAVIMGRQLLSEGYVNQPFMIEGSEWHNDGVYYMTPGGKLRWAAAIPEDGSKVKRLPWHTMAWTRTLREKPMSKIFNREFKRQLIKAYRRRQKRR